MKYRQKNPYIKTDLAAELAASRQEKESVSFRETEESGIAVTQVRITDEKGARAIGKPIGTYITLQVGKLWTAASDTVAAAERVLTREIRMLTEACAPRADCILIAGLGNPYITSDSLGPAVLKHITVTRHLRTLDNSLFNRLGSAEIAAISPGVVGQTGIETLELIRGAVETVHPSVLIVIDALASRSPDRLAATVQLSDSGLEPGSGIGNRRKAISPDTVGIPVIAIGVPTVVSSATLVYDALEKAGISAVSPALHEVLENGKSFFVSLKECDTAIDELAKLIGSALNHAFGKTD